MSYFPVLETNVIDVTTLAGKYFYANMSCSLYHYDW